MNNKIEDVFKRIPRKTLHENVTINECHLENRNNQNIPFPMAINLKTPQKPKETTKSNLYKIPVSMTPGTGICLGRSLTPAQIMEENQTLRGDLFKNHQKMEFLLSENKNLKSQITQNSANSDYQKLLENKIIDLKKLLQILCNVLINTTTQNEEYLNKNNKKTNQLLNERKYISPLSDDELSIETLSEDFAIEMMRRSNIIIERFESLINTTKSKSWLVQKELEKLQQDKNEWNGKKDQILIKKDEEILSLNLLNNEIEKQLSSLKKKISPLQEHHHHDNPNSNNCGLCGKTQKQRFFSFFASSLTKCQTCAKEVCAECFQKINCCLFCFNSKRVQTGLEKPFSAPPSIPQDFFTPSSLALSTALPDDDDDWYTDDIIPEEDKDEDFCPDCGHNRDDVDHRLCNWPQYKQINSKKGQKALPINIETQNKASKETIKSTINNTQLRHYYMQYEESLQQIECALEYINEGEKENDKEKRQYGKRMKEEGECNKKESLEKINQIKASVSNDDVSTNDNLNNSHQIIQKELESLLSTRDKENHTFQTPLPKKKTPSMISPFQGCSINSSPFVSTPSNIQAYKPARH